MIAVGIDPGVTTGIAVWNVYTQRLETVESMKIHHAISLIEELHLEGDLAGGIVMFEDARQRRWYGGRDVNQSKYGAGVREGAGSVKRDCRIWEDFLTDLGVPFLARSPKSSATKKKAEEFQRLTGWTGRTSEHARDAALIVFGLNKPMIEGLIRDFHARRRRK